MFSTPPTMTQQLLLAALIIAGAPLVLRTLRDAMRGHFATDVVASLSIIGAVALRQPIAGLVIVLMQLGGEALERYAERRASAAVRALENAAPRIAHRVEPDRVIDIAVGDINVGDELLVRPGDIVPCDGIVASGESELDTSSVTGEAVPRPALAGVRVLSGMANGVGSFHMRATAVAEESQYCRIVELVRSAQGSKAPLQRLADRYAVWFTPFTLAFCGLALYATHDWNRVLAILVVATPCPLILAAPVAFIGGINRAARDSVMVRNGTAIERIATVDVAVFDKTGTLTVGKPKLTGVHIAPGMDRTTVLRLAAGAEEHSSHLLARVLVDAVRAEGIGMVRGNGHIETPGQGVAGIIDGRRVRVGARSFVIPHCDDGVYTAASLEHEDAALRAYASIDGKLAAVFEYGDELRPDLPDVLASLDALGIHRIVLLSGDHAPIARALAERVGINEVHGDLLPPEKAQFVERLQAEGHRVVMVGDGINDAPALSTADVGIALAAHGGGITAEAADIIVLADSLERVPAVISIGRRTLRIARQSMVVGLGLSGICMIVALFGGLRPVVGAGLQEAIDVIVILNALRTAKGSFTLESRNGGARGTSPDAGVRVRRVSTVRA
jgi:heavy metal translocating P-type ATPase